ncbi:ARM repeat-containing protein [Aureobasidium sp. EXF-12298]|nr:ARM repeat-containing protein [Aureobasidium sp. EXF-12298]KAI4766537.1 ARM repeat-containing protein [Aureobasidium sp. EXF-12344]KAI4784072.1 ARM repeat-containing protein [Aureobasidium sp. EXF-3400]
MAGQGSGSAGRGGTVIDKLDYHPGRPLLRADDEGESSGRPSAEHSYAGSFFEQVAEGIQNRDRQKMQRQLSRYLTFAWAIVNCLVAGSITCFSVYAPLFQKRLHYTQLRVNTISITAELGMYLPVPIFGFLCDRYGPGIPSILSGCFAGFGYILAAFAYRNPDWPFAVMVFSFVWVGMATSCMYLSAVTTCAKNFGRGKHKGLALALPIAAFGLSGMWESQVGSRLLYEKKPDGTPGDIDVFRFFVFLGCTLFSAGVIGFFLLRIIDEDEMIDEAIEELEQSGLLEDSAFFRRGHHHEHHDTYGAVQDEDDEEERQRKEEEEARKKTWLLNEETSRFLSDRTMWLLAGGFFLVTGPGEAFINNLGTVIGTLYPPNVPDEDIPTSAATHVSIVAITSTIARILTGTLSDLFAPTSVPHQHRRGPNSLMSSMATLPGTDAAEPQKRLEISRITFLLVFSLVMSVGQAVLASGVVQDHGERFWWVSAAVGAGYGAVFSLTPIITSVVWGVENFDSSTIQRAEELVAQARACIEQRQLQKATQLAKEAASLAPTNQNVQALVRSLSQAESDGSQILSLVKSYVECGDQKDGQEAVNLLKQHVAVPSDHINDVAHLLFDHDGKPTAIRDELTGAFVINSAAARKQLANRIQVGTEATRYFRLLWRRGEHSFNSILPVLLDTEAWPNAEVQTQAKRDAFLLALGKLLDPALEHGEWSMTLIARLLTSNAHDMAGLIDRDAFEIVLAQLDIRLDTKIRAQATLAVAKLLEETREEGEAIFTDYITNGVAKGHNDELIVAFSAAASVFPLVPQTVAKLFLTPGFLEGLVPVLERNSMGQRKSHRLEQAAMELLSAACVDKTCRESISKVAYDWLDDVAHTSTESAAASMAALVLAKIPPKPESEESSITHADDLSSLLVNLTMNASSPAEQQSSIEGLAYTSLQPKIKMEIVSNSALLDKLIERLKSTTTADPCTFGILTIFSNLVSYRPAQSEEQQKMSQLKDYAEAKKPGEKDSLDDDKHVTVRCKTVLDADLVPVLVAAARSHYTVTILGIAAKILHALAREQKHRGKLAQQGAVKLLLQTIDRLQTPTGPASSSDSAQAAIHLAAHALARILISVDPNHVFSRAMPAISALRPLTLLLTPDTSSDTRDLLPVFESLLALTNLASLEDETVKDALLRQAWDPTQDLLLSTNKLVQRASVELVCNLMASPAGVAKYAGGSAAAKQRLHILLALADAEDDATRRAAGGALAMLTEWDAAANAVLEHERGIPILLDLCADSSDDVKHRGLVCVLNVISAPGDIGAKGLDKVVQCDGLEEIKDSLRECRDANVMAVGVEVLKAIMAKDGNNKGKAITQG